jgi:hypothetical protein
MGKFEMDTCSIVLGTYKIMMGKFEMDTCKIVLVFKRVIFQATGILLIYCCMDLVNCPRT